MEITILSFFIIAFIISLILSIWLDSPVLAGICLVFALLSGYFIFDSGIEFKQGSNTSIVMMDENTTIVNTNPKIYQVPMIWTNSIAILFFLFAFFLISKIVTGKNE